MNVRVLREHCCGNGLCAEIAPGVFLVDTHRRATVLDSEGSPLELVIEAAQACPCAAIVVEDDEGNLVAP
jgi:ferredoxin